MDMTADLHTSLVCGLTSRFGRAIVSIPDEVRVSSKDSSSGATIISIIVAAGPDKGKLIGKQGRNARSPRVLLQAIAKKHGKLYRLDIEGVTTEDLDHPS